MDNLSEKCLEEILDNTYRTGGYIIGQFKGTLLNESDDPVWNKIVKEINDRKMVAVLVDGIIEESTGKKINGLCSLDPETKIIFIDVNTEENYVSHVAGHELGHAMMHNGLKSYACNKEIRNKMEFEAQLFSVTLTLMVKTGREVDLDVLAEAVQKVSKEETFPGSQDN